MTTTTQVAEYIIHTLTSREPSSLVSRLPRREPFDKYRLVFRQISTEYNKHDSHTAHIQHAVLKTQSHTSFSHLGTMQKHQQCQYCWFPSRRDHLDVVRL